VYFFTSMLAHGAIVTAGVHCAVVEGYRPTWSALWRVAGAAIGYTAVIFGLNIWLGSNYMFIGRKPDFPSLIDWLGPWPWYVLSLVAIGVLVLHLLYLPFVLPRVLPRILPLVLPRGRGRMNG
jgi:hypothetical integral membrane protein (TIGR02206 family)